MKLARIHRRIWAVILLAARGLGYHKSDEQNTARRAGTLAGADREPADGRPGRAHANAAHARVAGRRGDARRRLPAARYGRLPAGTGASVGIHIERCRHRAGAARDAGIGIPAAGVPQPVRPFRALCRTAQGGGQPQGGLRHIRSERDISRAEQAAPRARGDQRAGFLPRRHSAASQGGARRGRGIGAQAAFPGAGTGRRQAQ